LRRGTRPSVALRRREREEPFAMLQDLWIKHREWVFEPLYYSSLDALIGALDEKSIEPAKIRFVESPGEEGREDERGARLAGLCAAGVTSAA
jgi:hypothetical protein